MAHDPSPRSVLLSANYGPQSPQGYGRGANNPAVAYYGQLQGQGQEGAVMGSGLRGSGSGLGQAQSGAGQGHQNGYYVGAPNYSSEVGTQAVHTMSLPAEPVDHDVMDVLAQLF